MNNFLNKNKNKIDSLRNYLYSNDLTEDEINTMISDFGKYFYLKGIDTGTLLEKDTQTRIKNAIRNKRSKIFNKIFNDIRNNLLNK